MFQGFTDQTFEFYMAIRFNNNRSFYLANRDWYQHAVRDPMVALCEALSETISQIDANLDIRPGKCVARINRDTRFSRDKSPYRDYSFMKYRPVGADRYAAVGFYFDLSDSGASWGMGIYEKNLPLMNELSRLILTSPQAVLQAVQPIAGEFVLHGDVIKRMQPPQDIEQPLRAWYGLRSFYVEKPCHDFDLIKSPDLADAIARSYCLAKPLYRLLTGLDQKEEL